MLSFGDRNLLQLSALHSGEPVHTCRPPGTGFRGLLEIVVAVQSIGRLTYL